MFPLLKYLYVDYFTTFYASCVLCKLCKKEKSKLNKQASLTQKYDIAEDVIKILYVKNGIKYTYNIPRISSHICCFNVYRKINTVVAAKKMTQPAVLKAELKIFNKPGKKDITSRVNSILGDRGFHLNDNPCKISYILKPDEKLDFVSLRIITSSLDDIMYTSTSNHIKESNINSTNRESVSLITSNSKNK